MLMADPSDLTDSDEILRLGRLKLSFEVTAVGAQDVALF